MLLALVSLTFLLVWTRVPTFFPFFFYALCPANYVAGPVLETVTHYSLSMHLQQYSLHPSSAQPVPPHSTLGPQVRSGIRLHLGAPESWMLPLLHSDSPMCLKTCTSPFAAFCLSPFHLGHIYLSLSTKPYLPYKSMSSLRHTSLCLRSRAGPRTGAGHRNVWMNWVYDWIKSKSVSCNNPSFLQQANPDQPILLMRDISCRSRLNSSPDQSQMACQFPPMSPQQCASGGHQHLSPTSQVWNSPWPPWVLGPPGLWKVTALLLKGVRSTSLAIFPRVSTFLGSWTPW